MRSSEHIRREDNANGFPPCFKGYSNDDDAGSVTVRPRRDDQQRDQDALAENDLQSAKMPAINSEDVLNLDANDAVTDPNRPADFGAPDEKLAALRKVLHEIESEEASAPEVAPDDASVPEPMRPGADPSERNFTPSASLFRRDDHLTDLDAAVAPGKEQVVFTIADLRRAHMNRAKRHADAMARRNKRGPFLSGIVLASAVAATMVGLYVMHPQIITARPQLAPALNEYVETVDRYRAAGAERTAECREWLTDRIDSLTAAKQ